MRFSCSFSCLLFSAHTTVSSAILQPCGPVSRFHGNHRSAGSNRSGQSAVRMSEKRSSPWEQLLLHTYLNENETKVFTTYVTVSCSAAGWNAVADGNYGMFLSSSPVLFSGCQKNLKISKSTQRRGKLSIFSSSLVLISRCKNSCLSQIKT